MLITESHDLNETFNQILWATHTAAHTSSGIQREHQPRREKNWRARIYLLLFICPFAKWMRMETSGFLLITLKIVRYSVAGEPKNLQCSKTNKYITALRGSFSGRRKMNKFFVLKRNWKFRFKNDEKRVRNEWQTQFFVCAAKTINVMLQTGTPTRQWCNTEQESKKNGDLWCDG